MTGENAMSRYLGRIAIVGLGVGFTSLALAYALGGRDIERLVASGYGWRTCGEAKAGATERRLTWNGGDGIEMSLPGSVRLVASPGDDVLVRGAADAIAHIELRGRRLGLCGSSATMREVEIEVPARALRRVQVSGATRVALAKLDQPELVLNVSGSSSVRAQGSVGRLTARLSGAGEMRLGELALKSLTTKISGSGSLEAAPKDEADIRISGAGSVRLLSRPAILRSKVSGAGRIYQPPLEAADSRR